MPPAEPLSAEAEAARVLPVIRALARDEATARLPLSVDTFHADVAAAAVQAGATLVNDVSGGALDPRMRRQVSAAAAASCMRTVTRMTCAPAVAACAMLSFKNARGLAKSRRPPFPLPLPPGPPFRSQVTELGVPFVVMHMRGTPRDMQSSAHTAYGDVAADVAAELAAAATAAVAAGVEPWRLILDPGLGFAKTLDGNFELIARLREVRGALPPPLRGAPLLAGPSRKGFLGRATGRQAAADRDHATAAAAALCVAGGAGIIRAHNVAAARDAARVADAVLRHAPQQH
jgi:2-amino-4-hydroxy-6-hydroxymethyldihydropteridine diphosphokinase/dihydropteroate synthase